MVSTVCLIVIVAVHVLVVLVLNDRRASKILLSTVETVSAITVLGFCRSVIAIIDTTVIVIVVIINVIVATSNASAASKIIANIHCTRHTS